MKDHDQICLTIGPIWPSSPNTKELHTVVVLSLLRSRFWSLRFKSMYQQILFKVNCIEKT